jgi:ubiquitin-protein ligase
MNQKGQVRLMKELRSLEQSNNTHIFLTAINENVRHLQALVIGAEGSPYEGVFLFFDIHPENSYPMTPPKFKFITPMSSDCRIHPNLYENNSNYTSGKVCLSILNTWANNEYSAVLTFEKILMTISGLLDNNPLANEPHQGNDKNACENYRLAARAWTLITVQQMLTRKDVPKKFRIIIKKFFIKNIDLYIESAKKLLQYDNKYINYFHGKVLAQPSLWIEYFEHVKEKSTHIKI